MAWRSEPAVAASSANRHALSTTPRQRFMGQAIGGPAEQPILPILGPSRKCPRTGPCRVSWRRRWQRIAGLGQRRCLLS